MISRITEDQVTKHILRAAPHINPYPIMHSIMELLDDESPTLVPCIGGPLAGKMVNPPTEGVYVLFPQLGKNDYRYTHCVNSHGTTYALRYVDEITSDEEKPDRLSEIESKLDDLINQRTSDNKLRRQTARLVALIQGGSVFDGDDERQAYEVRTFELWPLIEDIENTLRSSTT